MSGVGWRGSISSTSSSSAGSIMPSSSRPSTSPSPTNVPFVRSFRFSSQHDDRHHGLLTRKRTSSLPHDDTPPASDPFTAHPADSTSFVTYDAPPKRARNSLLLSLGLPRSKPKKKPPPSPTPFLFSEVIEISAPPPTEDEEEERRRLRDAAAHAIGLDPVLLEEREAVPERSETPTPTLPPFPAAHSALEPFAQLSARVTKHYPPPSLLMFALARQWKPRLLLLTSSSHVAHLHLFKGGSTLDECELERLEIGADSVAFVAENDVGGRRGVVKVGGPGSAGEMTLHLANSAEAQRWIAAIKHAVLSQRSVRAGLGVMAQTDGVEPRGDLDVMLSMRAQGLFSSPPSSTASAAATPRPVSPPRTTPPNSIRTASPQHQRPASAVSALRGLFVSTRPRSPSVATLDSPSERPSTDAEDASFGRAGTSLMGMLRSTSISSERPLSPAPLGSVPSTPRAVNSPDLPIPPPTTLDCKILQDKDRESLLPSISRSSIHGTGMNGNGLGLSLGIGLGMSQKNNGHAVFTTSSLHPPPRRRAWTSSGPPSGQQRTFSDGTPYVSTNGNGNAVGVESLGMRQANGSAFLPHHPSSPPTPGSTFLSPHVPSSPQSPATSLDGRPRTSCSSVSSLGSGEQPRTSFDFGISKRWSRQGSQLPKRLTPPSGPPPATPPSASSGSPTPASTSLSPSPSNFRASLQRHPYAAESQSQSPPTRSPSQRSATSPQCLVSGLQTFSKRASGSSVHSFSTVSSLAGHHPHPRSSHRTSIPPPPRPAPSTALPPTPGEDDSVPAPAPAPLLTPPSSPPHPPHSAPSTKTSFRESLTLRTHRFSLSPPTQPPASALPPRPDEAPIARSHRRSISSGNTTLAPIPASPTPLVPPFPPPNGPLPPTPHSGPPSASPAGLLKRRLRMLSAPSPSPPPAGPPPPAPAPPSPAPSTINPYSIPSTPIGEPIMTFQNDPCFLFTTPPTPPPQYPLPQTPRLLPPPPEQSPEMHGLTSLSPPPRHGSRRISTQDEEKDEREEGGRPERDEQEEAHSTENSTATSAGRPSLPLSLSPHHSISSLEDVFI